MLHVSRFQQIQYFHISSNQNIMPVKGIRRIMAKDPADQELQLRIRDHRLLINNIYMLPVSRFQQIQYFHISSNQNIMSIEGIRRIVVKNPVEH